MFSVVSGKSGSAVELPHSQCSVRELSHVNVYIKKFMNPAIRTITNSGHPWMSSWAGPRDDTMRWGGGLVFSSILKVCHVTMVCSDFCYISRGLSGSWRAVSEIANRRVSECLPREEGASPGSERAFKHVDGWRTWATDF
jgi:hypothetical protein